MGEFSNLKKETVKSLFTKHIIKREVDNQPYLIRWRILSTPWFKIRIHKILLSDNDCPHDHPWNFISIILKGGYFEHSNYKTMHYPKGLQVAQKIKWYKPGSVLFRRAEWKHKLELKWLGIGKGMQECLTLVIMFKRRREWGFWTPRGFEHWKKYDAKQKCE